MSYQKNLLSSVSAEEKQLEGLYNFFVSQALSVITVIDKVGTILYQSPSIKQILGYDNKKRVGKNLLHSRIVHHEDAQLKERLLKKAVTTSNTNFIGEFRMLHKNGTWRWMEVIFNNQLKNSAIGGIVVVTHDITERKMFELQKDEFLSIASHELKTPLTTIRAFSQLLAKKLAKEENKKLELSFLEKIISQTDRITRLISELLDISKIQEGKYLSKFKTFRLDLLYKKIVDDFSYVSDSHKLEFKVVSRVFVKGDESHIGQVLINLLSNAIKYSPESKKIVIKMKQKGNYIITSVKDYGEGIPLKKQKFVFQRFFRIHEDTTQQVSSGLGLYISNEIINLHKGNMWLKSVKGKGSTFYFSLPIYTKTAKKDNNLS